MKKSNFFALRPPLKKVHSYQLRPTLGQKSIAESIADNPDVRRAIDWVFSFCFENLTPWTPQSYLYYLPSFAKKCLRTESPVPMIMLCVDLTDCWNNAYKPELEIEQLPHIYQLPSCCVRFEKAISLIYCCPNHLSMTPTAQPCLNF